MREQTRSVLIVLAQADLRAHRIHAYPSLHIATVWGSHVDVPSYTSPPLVRKAVHFNADEDECASQVHQHEALAEARVRARSGARVFGRAPRWRTPCRVPTALRGGPRK